MFWRRREGGGADDTVGHHLDFAECSEGETCS